METCCEIYICNKMEPYFISRGYNKPDAAFDKYYYYIKPPNIIGINSSIFIYKNSKNEKEFISYSVHSYDYDNCKNNDIILNNKQLKVYIESELGGETTLINFYEWSDNHPIGLVIHYNGCYFTYEITIPDISEYDDFFVDINIKSKPYNINISREELNLWLNKNFVERADDLRKIIEEVEKMKKQLLEDMYYMNNRKV